MFVFIDNLKSLILENRGSQFHNLLHTHGQQIDNISFIKVNKKTQHTSCEQRH